MNILEFIRKNSILVLIVIIGVGLGLLVMDYGQKGNALSRDYYIQVNGKNFNAQERENLGGYAISHISGMQNAVPRRMRNYFDTDGNGQLDQTEDAAMEAWFKGKTQLIEGMNHSQAILTAWSFGYAPSAKTNIAINRALLAEEAKALGIYPSKEQIDAYIQALPFFQKLDGGFDQELYRRLAGYRNDLADSVSERALRAVIADMIVWEALQSLLVEGLSYQAQAATDLINIQMQDILGKTAWLDASKLPAIAEPTTEEIKTYWDSNKQNYKSAETRIVSLYTLTPGEGISTDELLGSAELLMQDIAQSNSGDIDAMIETAAQNPENAPFTYKCPAGKSHVQIPAYSKASIPAELSTLISTKNGDIPLGEVVFDVLGAPSMESYNKSTAAQMTNIQQLRGFYPNEKGDLLLIRVDAVNAPETLPYEQAEQAAKADLITSLKEKQLQESAQSLFVDMEAAAKTGGLKAAFKLAESRGATVDSFGPVSLESNIDLPNGMDAAALISVASDTFAPLVILPDGARISAVGSRSYTDSPQLATIKSSVLLPSMNSNLRQKLMIDWIHSAYKRYNVLLSKEAAARN